MDDWGFLGGTGASDGPVARRMRATDWAATPLGAPAGWPDLLRSTLATMMTSPQPMFVSWGPELTFLYNDAYEGILGLKAEGGPGRPFPAVWPEIWGDIEPMVTKAYRGEGSVFEDFPLTMWRHGAPEDTWWTFSYNPLRDAGGEVRGMFCAALESSARVLERQRAEAERERLALLFENAPGFMGLMEGSEHRFTLANPALHRLVGHRELLGRTVAEALPETVEQGYVAMLDQVRSSGEALAVQGSLYRVPPRPGAPPEDRYVDQVYQPVRDASGAVAGIFVEGHDVTEQHQTLAALRASEARFRTLFEALDEAVVIFERVAGPPGRSPGGPSDYRYILANRAARVAFDLDGAEGETTRARRPGVEESWYAHLDRVLDTGERERVEQRAADVGRVFEAYLAPIGDRGAGRLLSVTRDVTDRRAVEDALRDQNLTLERRVGERTAELRLLASIVETTDAFIQVVDPEFRWLGINRASADEFERIYGVRPRVGDSMLDLLADRPEHREAVRAVWARALGGEAFTETATVGDRERRTYEMKFEALRDPGGRVTAAFQIVTDATERIRAQERLLEAEAQLRQAQKMEAIGQLTGGVAHDFNNLLTPIVGALDVIQRRALGGPREQRLIEGAVQSAERARTLVSRLLAFARRQPLEVGPVDLARLVEGLRHLVVSTVGPQVRVAVHVAQELPAAVADQNQLEMAILNLAVNARDAMLQKGPQGGTLTIAACREEVAGGHPQGLGPGTYLRLWVEDTGAGMGAATLARAAEPFFSTKGTGKGTGLGLSMVHGLALQLGGAMGLESEPGRGTRVTLWLPAARRTALGLRPRAPAAAETGVGAGARIGAGAALLVDDETLVREATADMLAELGWRVTPVDSAEAALALVAEGLSPDLLVTDHLMPGMTGTDLALRLREFWPDLPVLVVSGFAEAEGLSPDLPRLPKPFRRDELAGALRQARRG